MALASAPLHLLNWSIEEAPVITTSTGVLYYLGIFLYRHYTHRITKKNLNQKFILTKKLEHFEKISKNDYLFGKNYSLNPKIILKDNPIITDIKLGYDKNTFVITERYQFPANITDVKDIDITLPVIIKISDYIQMMSIKIRSIVFREFVIEKFKYKAKDAMGSSKRFCWNFITRCWKL